MGAATVSRDIAYLNKQAHDDLKDHISYKLPEQYQKSLNGLNQVLKLAWNAVIIDSINQTNRLQALSLISDIYKYQLELSTNASVISDAMKFVNQKTEQLDTLKLRLKLNKEDEKIDEENVQTHTQTNDVF